MEGHIEVPVPADHQILEIGEEEELGVELKAKVEEKAAISKLHVGLLIMTITLTFSASYNPQGGLWSESKPKQNIKAGKSILHHDDRVSFQIYLFLNTIGMCIAWSLLEMYSRGSSISHRVGVFVCCFTVIALYSFGITIMGADVHADIASRLSTLALGILIPFGFTNWRDIFHLLNLLAAKFRYYLLSTP